MPVLPGVVRLRPARPSKSSASGWSAPTITPVTPGPTTPCSQRCADPLRRAQQRRLLEVLVGHGLDGLLLAAGAPQLADPGRLLRETAPGHGFAVVVCVSLPIPPTYIAVSGLAASRVPRTSSVMLTVTPLKTSKPPSTVGDSRLAVPLPMASAYSGVPPGPSPIGSQPSAISAASATLRWPPAAIQIGMRERRMQDRLQRLALAERAGAAVGQRDLLALVGHRPSRSSALRRIVM